MLEQTDQKLIPKGKIEHIQEIFLMVILLNLHVFLSKNKPAKTARIVLQVMNGKLSVSSA